MHGAGVLAHAGLMRAVRLAVSLIHQPGKPLTIDHFLDLTLVKLPCCNASPTRRPPSDALRAPSSPKGGRATVARLKHFCLAAFGALLVGGALRIEACLRDVTIRNTTRTHYAPRGQQ